MTEKEKKFPQIDLSVSTDNNISSKAQSRIIQSANRI